MTLLEDLTAHKGGLIRVKGGLYWYGDRGWDRITDRTVLLMDSARTYDGAPDAPDALTAACLLIDGRPHWVWIAPEDVELL